MPIYEYECVNNKHRFEVIQKFSDPPISTCSICGSPVEKVVSAPAIQFKGTGWYITDYARKSDGGNGAKSEKAPAAESKESGSPGEKKETSKPATSGETKPEVKD